MFSRAVLRIAVVLTVLAPAAGTAGQALLILGDSLTAGYGLPAGDGLVAQVERALRAEGLDVRVIDGGVSGDTAAGGRARLDWALAGKPTHAVVALGANNALRGLDPAAMEADLSAILERLAGAGVPALLAGMRAPRNLGAAYTEAFDAVFPRLARRHGAPLYPFLLDGVAGEARLNQRDGIHPNADGVAEIARRMLPALRDLLAR